MKCARLCSYHQNNLKQALRNSSSGSYYVLLPEIPPDTPETNEVMRVADFPDFQSVTPDKIITGCAKLAIEYETYLGKHLEDLKDQKKPKDFECVFQPIEEIAVPLNYAWRTAKNLNYVHRNPGYKQAFQRIHPQVERAKNERWISETLYNSVKEVHANRDNLTEFQRRLTEMYLLEARLNGVELVGSDRKRFMETLKRLSVERSNFRNKVMICQRLFSHATDDISMIQDFPPSLLAAMSENKLNPRQGPWKVTLQHNVYLPFMENCSKRELRWNAWHAFNNRAADNFADQNLGNHKIINEIRMYRSDIAKLLGYENFAQMSMETKMAGSVENVVNFLESLKTKFKMKAEDEIAELQEYAKSTGFKQRLQMWDLYYYRQKQRTELYQLDEAEITQYFQLNHVLNGLFSNCKRLFGITVKDCTDSVPEAWNSEVKFYNIYDEDGTYISSFYMDPFGRQQDKLGGVWMETGGERSSHLGTKPFSYLVMSLPTPVFSNVSPLMTLADVSMLFHQFGHGLQQLLTVVPYSEISGQRNVEWDALPVCATFMQQWLYLPQTLQEITCHQETGQPMPQDLIERIIKAEKHMCSYDMMRQVYLSAFDMEIHISKENWFELMERVWAQYMPLPLNDQDNHPCSFTHIFSDQYPAAYYSYKWSEMISADVLGAFLEVGLDDAEKVAAVGKRFRETFLSLGGGVPASEVFRRFRGRDPSLNALLELYQSK
ncbi:uncharacterized protein LOC135471020 [Liolophura sinensis]|uniref:uncharacterized protein LOC135471020 n=1 Tax=Liolophura sinensis TaxID=3198878 RepID=UPI0031582425